MLGRPTTKRKIYVNGRGEKHGVSKVGKKVACSICNEVGHNKKTCPTIDRPIKLKVNRAIEKNTRQETCM